MTVANGSHHNYRMEEYRRDESVVFLKTKEQYGGLSNMAGGFPLQVNGIPIRTTEALYQACRFPHRPEVQRLIIEQQSPMSAKMKSKPYRADSRSDWEQDKVRVKVMRWCLRVKLAQNWENFSQLLRETGDWHIVEQSRKDDFWGAKPIDDRTLLGANVLGRLLKELRGQLLAAAEQGQLETLQRVEPLQIKDFLLYGHQIEGINMDNGRAGRFTPPAGKPLFVDTHTEQARLISV